MQQNRTDARGRWQFAGQAALPTMALLTMSCITMTLLAMALLLAPTNYASLTLWRLAGQAAAAQAHQTRRRSQADEDRRSTEDACRQGTLSELLHLCGYTEHGYTCYGRQGTLSELLHLFEPTPLLMWLRTGQLSSLQGRLECVSATLLSLLQQHHPASGAVEHRSSEATLEGEAATVGAGAAAVGAGAAAKATGLLGRLREEGRGIVAELPQLPSLPSLPPLGSRGTPHTKAKRAAGHESNVEGGAEGGAASQPDGGYGHGGSMERHDIHWRLCKLLPLVVDMFVEERESGVRVLVRALGGLVELERRVRAGSRDDLGEQAGSRRALGLASGVERSTHSGASPSSPSSPSRPSSPQARHQDILPRHPTMRQPAIAPTPPHPTAPKPAPAPAPAPSPLRLSLRLHPRAQGRRQSLMAQLQGAKGAKAAAAEEERGRTSAAKKHEKKLSNPSNALYGLRYPSKQSVASSQERV